MSFKIDLNTNDAHAVHDLDLASHGEGEERELVKLGKEIAAMLIRSGRLGLGEFVVSLEGELGKHLHLSVDPKKK